jgi:hypothetical protein
MSLRYELSSPKCNGRTIRWIIAETGQKPESQNISTTGLAANRRFGYEEDLDRHPTIRELVGTDVSSNSRWVLFTDVNVTRDDLKEKGDEAEKMMLRDMDRADRHEAGNESLGRLIVI